MTEQASDPLTRASGEGTVSMTLEPPSAMPRGPSLGVKKRRCAACRDLKVSCDGQTPSCARCKSRSIPCCYTRRGKSRHPAATAVLRVVPKNQTAILFHHTATTVTRLFHEALVSGQLKSKKAAKVLAGWKLRENTMGLDYSHGACDDMLSMAGLDIKEEVLQQCSQESPVPAHYEFDLENLTKSWVQMDDGRSSMSCMVFKKGYWNILCNERFKSTFASQDEMEARVEHTRTLPSFYFGSTVSVEDHTEFAQLLANTFFLTEGDDRGDYTSVLKCIDRHGASFLAVVRIQLVWFGSASLVGMRLSILPLPNSQYLNSDTDISAPNFRRMPDECRASSSSSSSSSSSPPSTTTTIPSTTTDTDLAFSYAELYSPGVVAVEPTEENAVDELLNFLIQQHPGDEVGGTTVMEPQSPMPPPPRSPVADGRRDEGPY